MIRPNLRRFAAAVACLIIAPSVSCGQQGQYCEPGGPSLYGSPYASNGAPIQDHYMQGNTQLWDENRPIERFFSNVTSRSWVKLEFLMWNFGNDYDQIGAPVNNLQRGARPGEIEGRTLPVSLLNNFDNQIDTGAALFPYANSISNEDIPGMRGTLGVGLNGADLELSFFGLEQSSSDMTMNDISASRIRVGLADPSFGTNAFPNVAVPLLTNGQPTDVASLNALIFTDTFSAHIDSQMWGSELALLSERLIPGGAGPSWQWLGGFRYVNVDQDFGIRGTSVGSTAVTTIDSGTINNFYGPQIGGRAALTSKWLTLSATPRIMMGLNDNTSQVRSVISDIPGTEYKERNIDFGTVTQLNLAAEIHFNPQFSVYGGYDFMWLTGVSRAFDNVVYDSTSDANGTTANIRQDVDLENLMINGFSMGATFRY